MAASGRSNANETLATSLAAGMTVKDAAAAAGVSERTAARRLKLRGFARRVAHLRGLMMSEAVGRLSRSMGGAADVLADLLKSRNAARALIVLGVRLREHADLEARVADLERKAREETES